MRESRLLLLNNFLFAVMLAAPLVPGLSRYFANTYLCAGIILLLMFLDFRIYKAIGILASQGKTFSMQDSDWKFSAKLFSWAVLIPTVMLVGIGPITEPAAYTVDRFTRVFGQGVTDDYSVSKKVHYFYFAIIIYGLLVFNVCQSIRIALINNANNKILRLSGFSVTLLLTGLSFLLVLAYGQFSVKYSSSLTVFFLKTITIFMIPAFYFWQTGKLRVQDIRVMLALAFLSLVLSVNAVLYAGSLSPDFSIILAFALIASALLFVFNKTSSSLCAERFYSAVMAIALAGSFAIVLFSVFLELSNVISFRTGEFTDIETAGYVLYGVILVCGCILAARKKIGRKTAGLALFVFVLGVSLIQYQPSLVISSEFHAWETANYAVPVSDFLNFGKIPLFENFPGHGLHGVISSIAYGLLTGDYYDAVFAPWLSWLYCPVCIIALYCFTKRIANGLIALCVSVLLPYFVLPFLHEFTSYSCIGWFAVLPFIIYLKTPRKKYLVLTVLISLFLVAYKLDIGTSFLFGILCSSLFVSIFFRNRVIYRVLIYFAAGIAAIFTIFLLVCLMKDINPVSRIQEFLAITSSNDHWGYNSLGDREKNAYPLVFFIVPVLFAVCSFATVCFRKSLGTAGFALSVCMLSAYFFNIPRFLTLHSLRQYSDFFAAIWLWTMPFVLPFLISRLFACRSLVILCQTVSALLFFIYFQDTAYDSVSPLQNLAMSAERISAGSSPDTREKNISFIRGRGSRVIVEGSSYCGPGSDSLVHTEEIKAAANLLLSPDETFLDFSAMSAAYALSRRENPSYVVQPPSVLSGETTQKAFIREIESRLKNVPIAVMPADRDWCFVLKQDGNSYNIWHYLVAEWIYGNYRPLFKYNDFASVWALNSRYDEFSGKIRDPNFLKGKNTRLQASGFDISPEDAAKLSCHNCTIEITGEGLKITPVGSEPYLSGLQSLLGDGFMKPSGYIALHISNGSGTSGFRLFSAGGENNAPGKEYSLDSAGIAPGLAVFDLSSRPAFSGAASGIRLAVPEGRETVIRSVSAGDSFPLSLSPADWGYDNFATLPEGSSPEEKYISNAHDYNVRFLPYIWGQFDSRNASGNADLAKVTRNWPNYTWNYSGHESKPAYLRLDLSLSPEFVKGADASFLTLGSLENGKYTPLSRFRFRLKEGDGVYLFRISADYYWSRGKLKAISLDPHLRSVVRSVRILEGD